MGIERVLGMKARFRRADALGKYAGEEPPLRSALFSADQMERHGRTLADSHQLTKKSTPDNLLIRLSDNECVLVECSRVLLATASADR